jgi:hypothetical protein
VDASSSVLGKLESVPDSGSSSIRSVSVRSASGDLWERLQIWQQDRRMPGAGTTQISKGVPHLTLDRLADYEEEGGKMSTAFAARSPCAHKGRAVDRLEGAHAARQHEDRIQSRVNQRLAG